MTWHYVEYTWHSNIFKYLSSSDILSFNLRLFNRFISSSTSLIPRSSGSPVSRSRPTVWTKHVAATVPLVPLVPPNNPPNTRGGEPLRITLIITDRPNDSSGQNSVSAAGSPRGIQPLLEQASQLRLGQSPACSFYKIWMAISYGIPSPWKVRSDELRNCQAHDVATGDMARIGTLAGIGTLPRIGTSAILGK